MAHKSSVLYSSNFMAENDAVSIGIILSHKLRDGRGGKIRILMDFYKIF